MGIRTVIAYLHRSGTTPSVIEQLKMPHRGDATRVPAVVLAGCHQGQGIYFFLSFFLMLINFVFINSCMDGAWVSKLAAL